MSTVDVVKPQLKRIKLYTPFAGEALVHASKARFRVVDAGRRFGKTDIDINEIVRAAWEKPEYPYWWLSKTSQQTHRAFRLIKQHFAPAIAEENKSEMFFHLKSGGSIEFKSAEQGDALRGEGLGGVIVDEAAFVDRQVWEDCIRPSLADTGGWALLTSTPHGHNYFYQLYLRGQDRAANPDWESWKFPSWENPYLAASEIDDVRRTLPADVFKQEFAAEFLEDAAGVFHNIAACIRGNFEEPIPGHMYLFGWDPAKHQDFSVLYVMDREGRNVVFKERMSGIDYSIQLDRVANVARRYNFAKGLMDCTGVGDPLLEQLLGRNVGVEGYLFTNTSKQQLIENLVVGFEQELLSIPDEPVLKNELESFEYTLTRAGNVTYAAPEGENDDAVCALALVYWQLTHHVYSGGFWNA